MTPSPKSLIHVIRRQSALCLRYDEEGRLKTQIYTRYYKYGSGSISYFSFDQNFSYNEIDGTLSGCVIDGDGYSRAINYSYDDFGRLSTVGKSMVTLDGDGVGQNVSYTYVKHSDPDDGTITYNRVDSVTNEYVTLSNGVSSALTAEAFTYTYDASGNITEIKKNGATLFRYAYDSLNQLVREDNRYTGKSYTWTYDNAGNILNRKTYAYTVDALGTVQNTVIYGYDTGNWGDLLISFNGQSITYDGIGNPGTWNGSALTWQGRRLMSYGSNTYTYNAEGIRTSKTVNGVEHIYHLSGTRILDEEWTEGNIRHLMVYVYDASGQPIGISHYTYNGTIVSENDYLLVSNIRGDIIGIYDSTGTRVVTYVYDAWGRILSTTGTGANTIGVYNPFRYRGYYYDTETGFYYLNSRYYDPNVGRFLNADGSVNANGDLIGFNMFAYCGNNPVARVDHLGEAWLHWVLGAAVVVGFAALTVLTCGGSLALAATSIGLVANGVAAATTATTVAASAFLGSAATFGASAFIAACESKSINEFADNGNWGTVLSTAIGGLLSGLDKYIMYKVQTSQTDVSDDELFLPDSFYSKHAPKQSTPNTSYTNYTYNSYTGKYEKSTAYYDFAGRQIIRIDWTNHGYSDHGNPHVHFTTYSSRYRDGITIRWD